MLDLSSKLATGSVFPTEALASYLDLKKGPTNTLVYTVVQKNGDNDEILYKIIEAVYMVLRKCDFKVGQLHRFGEYLVNCSSAVDADQLHNKVKVCKRTVIGFRKMDYVFTVDLNKDVVQKEIKDANPDEYKICKELKDELNTTVAKLDAEVSGSKKRKI